MLLMLIGVISRPLTSAAQSNRFDFSAGASAVFSKSSSGNGTTVTPTNSLGFLATARYRFDAKQSLAFNYGRTKNSQIFSTVFSPMETEKLEPFLFAGAGALVFNPTNTFIDGFQLPVAAVRQTEIAFLYGGGVDYRVRSFVGLRLQYRGLIYKAPDFSFPGFLTGGRGHLAEPSIGLVFKF